MKTQNANDPEKLIRKYTDDEYTVQMLLQGLDCLRQLADADLEVNSVEKSTEMRAEACASQKVHGPVDACALICGALKDVRKVAEGYVGASFIESDEDALDAVCELINTANGMFARSFEEEDEDLEPPFYRQEPSIVQAKEIYMVNLKLCGASIVFCIAYDAGIAGA